MKAMIFEKVGVPLKLCEVPMPRCGPHDILVHLEACGVCRTDLHIIDGELPHPKLPLILGHQAVGYVEEVGTEVKQWQKGERVGIPWLGGCCEQCEYCQTQRENLCEHGVFTGYTRDGGFAEFIAVNSHFALTIPKNYSAIEAAPLLCAGLIGYRAYRKGGKPKALGLYGFGSSAHITLQIAKYEGSQVYVFTRPHDINGQQFALSLGADWVGGSDQMPPVPLDAALIFAPAGELMPQALKVVKKGGQVISVGIHMSDIPSFPYALLWEERSLTSVANLTRADGVDFFKIAAKTPLQPHITSYSIEQANEALEALRRGALHGSLVLTIP